MAVRLAELLAVDFSQLRSIEISVQKKGVQGVVSLDSLGEKVSPRCKLPSHWRVDARQVSDGP